MVDAGGDRRIAVGQRAVEVKQDGFQLGKRHFQKPCSAKGSNEGSDTVGVGKGFSHAEAEQRTVVSGEQADVVCER